MLIKDIAKIIENANRPIDIFGDVSPEEIKKKYLTYIKYCHPDLVAEKDKLLADNITKKLNEYYEKAKKELVDGTYNITNEKELYKKKESLFDFELRGKKYQFYDYITRDDVCDIYDGLCDDELVTLKIVVEEEDNSLIDDEYNTLKKLNHLSIPKPLNKLKINGKNAVILSKSPGLTIEVLKKTYGNISGEHVAWILERLLSVAGYLHSNKIVHGNIKEDNVLIDPETHNVILQDYSFCINDAANPDSRYKMINEYYSPSYVDSTARVIPNVDIYAVGIIAINLLGGDIEKIAIPTSCDVRLRTFIRKLLKKEENDAWKLWDELIKIRKETYGTIKFKKLVRNR